MPDSNPPQETSSKLPPNEYYGRPTMLGLYGQSLKTLAATIALTYAGARLASQNPAQPPQERPPHTAPAPTHEQPTPTITPTPTVADILARINTHIPEATFQSPIATSTTTNEPTSTPTQITQSLETDQASATAVSTLPFFTPVLNPDMTQVPVTPTHVPTSTSLPSVDTMHGTVSQLDTATPAPTTESLESVLEKLSQETNITIKHIKENQDGINMENYDMSISDADDELTRVAAHSILQLPPEVKKTLRENWQTIYIARFMQAEQQYYPNVINFIAFQTGENKDHVVLEVADGPKYTAQENAEQKSGLEAKDELMVALSELAFRNFLLTPEGKEALSAFMVDNPEEVDQNNPNLRQFTNLLRYIYIDDGSNTPSLTEIIARLAAMKMAGQQEDVKKAISLATDAKLIDFTHAPLGLNP